MRALEFILLAFAISPGFFDREPDDPDHASDQSNLLVLLICVIYLLHYWMFYVERRAH